MLDSTADFLDRAAKLGANQQELQNLQALGYDTFGKLAFATSYTPGQQDDTLLKHLAAEVTGQDPPPAARLPIVRRLFFESYTLAAADMQMRLERKDDAVPRLLANAERSSRYEDQKKRLSGIDMTGLIRETKVSEALKANTDTDLKLRLALPRRSLAFDQARLVDYNAFEKWTQTMMEAYGTVPPEGYLRVSVEQLHRADLQLFKAMMRETRSGIKPLVGIRPVEQALLKAMDSAEVRLCLQPLQGTNKRKLEPAEDDKKPKPSPDVSKLQKTVENLQGQIKNMRANPSAPVKGRKGRGKGGKTNLIRMPPQLIGMAPTNPQGEPHCYDYNIKGCSRAKPGERCPKGWHCCMRWGCGKPHPQFEHQ
ncbi:unnamed protein product [Cladocopium goreaui]|uniref:Multidrug resistance protein 1A n=1 Tax=Cladocopium goreaui TaxID=2562237 RepID=A0A9P1DFP4_9DINO|nr:unnamed protein product [Cladocopium goreaui]